MENIYDIYHMIEVLIISIFACLIAILTFFSGFGLGTLLTPVLIVIFPAELAITLTGIVHLVNNIFKWLLVRKKVDWSIVIKFGGPAIIAAFIGAYLLFTFKNLDINYSYTLFGKSIEQNLLKIIISIILFFFTLTELTPKAYDQKFDAKWLPIGGLLSGFFGGLSGIQGALRSAFLIKINLSKESFIATTITISTLVDFSRIGVYFSKINILETSNQFHLLIFTCLGAITGSIIGNFMLKKTTIKFVQKLVNICLLILAISLAIGVI